MQQPDPGLGPSDHTAICAAVVEPAYLQAAKSLQLLGFPVKASDSNIHWSDLLMSAPGVNWKETCKLLLFCLSSIQDCIDRGVK